MKTPWLLASLAIGSVMAGCMDRGDTPDARSESAEGAPASLRIGLVERIGSAFPGKSVKISGRRRNEAGPTYPCLSQFTGACLDLRDDALAAPQDATRAIDGLCPSDDLRARTNVAESSLWDFDLALFDGEGCGGKQLTQTGAYADVVCYGRETLGFPGAENRIVGERLTPGTNVNDVVCIVKPPR
jgi:hypothetical protein